MIGILSDSHDNLTRVREAVRLFNDAGCDLVIHAGDFVAPFTVDELRNLRAPVKAVFGNCDGEKAGLAKAFEGLGELREAPLKFSTPASVSSSAISTPPSTGISLPRPTTSSSSGTPTSPWPNAWTGSFSSTPERPAAGSGAKARSPSSTRPP